MTQKYIPTKWVANETIGTANVMNNIEQGIVNAHSKVDINSTEINNLKSDFSDNSINGNGYYKLPNGLLIQWGHSYYTDLVTGQWVDKQISLPTPFTTCFNCIVTASCNDRGSNRDLQALLISNNSVIKSDFMVSMLTDTPSLWGGVSWIAIGI